MSKLNEIQKRLLELDQGTLQKLAAAYLREEGYENVSAPGETIGSNKTRTGTPDAFVARPDGSFDFIECTSQKEQLRSKLDGDLEKCLDSSRTGIPISSIRRFVFCHTGRLTPADIKNASAKCRANAIQFFEYGTETMAHDLLLHYPGLVREFIGLSIDTGQFASVDVFVKRYDAVRKSVPLDTPFGYREAELAKLVELVEAQRCVFLVGAAGLGKTRLALEAVRTLKNRHPQHIVYCIHPKHPDIYDDLTSYVSPPGKYILLVDDANRVNRFEYVAETLENCGPHREFFVVATVRDYAQAGVLDRKIEGYSPETLRLQALGDDAIKELLRRTHGIESEAYLSRIASIARGNPRLAMMAGAVAKQENRLTIASVSGLYEAYFSEINRELNELQDRRVVRVIAVIALFRWVDGANDQAMRLVGELTDVQGHDFWRIVERLNQLEIIDLVTDPKAARVSDQVLASYMFFRAVFVDRTLSLELVLRTCFFQLPSRVADILNPVLRAFGDETRMAELQKIAKTLWIDPQYLSRDEDRYQFATAFWSVLSTEALLYAQQAILDSDVKSGVAEESRTTCGGLRVLELLGLFGASRDGDASSAAKLILCYYDRWPDQMDSVAKKLRENYGFAPRDHYFAYSLQRTIVDSIWDRAQEGRNEQFTGLFLAVAPGYLERRCDSTRYERGVVTITSFAPPPTDELKMLRRSILRRIAGAFNAGLYGSKPLDEIDKALESCDETNLLASDAEVLVPALCEMRNPYSFRVQLTVYRLYCAMLRAGICGAEALESHLGGEYIFLYELCTGEDRGVRRWDSFKRLEVKDALSVRYADRPVAACEADLEKLSVVKQELRDSERWIFDEAVHEIFGILGRRLGTGYWGLLKRYLASGDRLQVSQVASVLMPAIALGGAKQCYEDVAASTFAAKPRWLLNVCLNVPDDELDEQWLNKLYALYRHMPALQVWVPIDLLKRYAAVEPGVIVEVCRIVMERASRDAAVAGALVRMFEVDRVAGGRQLDIFAGDMKLIENAYLRVLELAPHVDHDGSILSALVERRWEFMIEYFDWRANHEDRHWLGSDGGTALEFLWERPDYSLRVEEIARHAYLSSCEEPVYLNSALTVFFRADDKGTEAKQDGLLDKLIRENVHDLPMLLFLFRTIGTFPRDRHRKFVEAAIDAGCDADVFRSIEIELEPDGWVGSATTHYRREIDYLRSLLPLVCGLDKLLHRRHLETRIAQLEDQVTCQIRREALQDRY